MGSKLPNHIFNQYLNPVYEEGGLRIYCYLCFARPSLFVWYELERFRLACRKWCDLCWAKPENARRDDDTYSVRRFSASAWECGGPGDEQPPCTREREWNRDGCEHKKPAPCGIQYLCRAVIKPDFRPSTAPTRTLRKEGCSQGEQNYVFAEEKARGCHVAVPLVKELSLWPSIVTVRMHEARLSTENPMCALGKRTKWLETRIADINVENCYVIQ
ncbi:hypothetical protein GGX14DRAFT_391586 [Mycena pura]|uniref:Uncharacterized protein n=1 Tax=Mycena pura TaxID=153505 RepID=A0AAD6YJM0_9AGAR|nr:hypothetical protein GGX14DRAFT_391586 [Mycena pura]